MSMSRKRGREIDEGGCQSSAGCECSNELCDERCKDGCSQNCPDCARLENEKEVLAAGLAAHEASIVYHKKSCEMHKKDTLKIRHNLGSILGLLSQGDRHGHAEPRSGHDGEVKDRDGRDAVQHRRAEAWWRDEGRDKESGGEQSRTGSGWHNAGPSQ